MNWCVYYATANNPEIDPSYDHIGRIFIQASSRASALERLNAIGFAIHLKQSIAEGGMLMVNLGITEHTHQEDRPDIEPPLSPRSRIAQFHYDDGRIMYAEVR